MALSGIELSGSILIGTTLPMDAKYGPYSDTSIPAALALALAEVTSGFRYQGLTVGLVDTSAGTEVVEYWFKDGVADIDLVEKQTGGGGSVYEILVTAPDTLRLTDGTYVSDVKFVGGSFIDVQGTESPDQFDIDLSATGLGSPADKYFLRGDNTWARSVPSWVEDPGININFNVCQPISTSTNWPDNSPGINWYFQAAGPLAQKWTPTANNPRVRRKDFLGTETSVDITTHLTAMSDNFNNIEWVLKIVDPANPANFADLAGSLLPPGKFPGTPIITIGGSYGSFGPGWTENTIFNFNMAFNYFDLYGIDVGQLELHIYNNGANGSIITGCTVQFSTP